MMVVDLLCCVVDEVAGQRVWLLGLPEFIGELRAPLFSQGRRLVCQAVVGLAQLICRALSVAT